MLREGMRRHDEQQSQSFSGFFFDTLASERFKGFACSIFCTIRANFLRSTFGLSLAIYNSRFARSRLAVILAP